MTCVTGKVTLFMSVAEGIRIFFCLVRGAHKCHKSGTQASVAKNALRRFSGASDCGMKTNCSSKFLLRFTTHILKTGQLKKLGQGE